MKSRFLMFAAACLLCLGQAQARVNVNTATPEELQSLYGIGEVRAQAIIDYRRQNGPFKSIRDLRKVPDIPESVLVGLKGKVSYSGQTNISASERDSKSESAKAERASPAGTSVQPAKPKALPPPKPVAKSVEQAAPPASPAPMNMAKPAGPASPARPAMPGKSASESKPVVAPPSADEKQPTAAAVARPAMPGKPAAPARPAVSEATPAAPSAGPAKPASPVGKPAAPAMPGAPAKPASPAQPAAY
jgi:competence protein ComEA